MLSFEKSGLSEKCRIYQINSDGTFIRKCSHSEYISKDEDSKGNHITLKVTGVESENENRNVVSNRYEGGHTIWESSWILLTFLYKLQIQSEGLAIELGCGHGLCGIYATLRGFEVLFQDLNMEVLHECLVPNYLLNILIDVIKDGSFKMPFEIDKTAGNARYSVIKRIYAKSSDDTSGTTSANPVEGGEERVSREKSGDMFSSSFSPPQLSKDLANVLELPIRGKIELFSGTWDEMNVHSHLIEDRVGNCTLILASECIYRKENYETIARLFLKYLKPSYGVAYIATKRFYFGLAGGSFSFLDFLANTQNLHQEFKLDGKLVHSVRPVTSANFIDIIEIHKHAK